MEGRVFSSDETGAGSPNGFELPEPEQEVAERKPSSQLQLEGVRGPWVPKRLILLC